MKTLRFVTGTGTSIFLTISSRRLSVTCHDQMMPEADVYPARKSSFFPGVLLGWNKFGDAEHFPFSLNFIFGYRFN